MPKPWAGTSPTPRPCCFPPPTCCDTSSRFRTSERVWIGAGLGGVGAAGGGGGRGSGGSHSGSLRQAAAAAAAPGPGPPCRGLKRLRPKLRRLSAGSKRHVSCLLLTSLEHHSTLISDAVRKVIKVGKVSAERPAWPLPCPLPPAVGRSPLPAALVVFGGGGGQAFHSQWLLRGEGLLLLQKKVAGRGWGQGEAVEPEGTRVSLGTSACLPACLPASLAPPYC